MKTKASGFTLIEILITMALFMMVIAVTGSAFTLILKATGRLTTSEESNISGMVGLEIMRHDLQQAGYGMPTAYMAPPPTYTEASFTPANSLNDAPHGIPRPFASLDSVTNGVDSNTADGLTYTIVNGTDYLSIKATTVGRAPAARKWTFVAYSGAVGETITRRRPNVWPTADENLASTDYGIVLKRTFDDTGTTSTLVFNNTNTGTAANFYTKNTTALLNNNFNPISTDPPYVIYGISDTTPGMPFNRVDYMVATPSDSSAISKRCASNTGILYKATVNHSDGKLSYLPLLDCVADMQVVFGWDTTGDGKITESSAYSSNPLKISVAGTATYTDIQTIMEDPLLLRNALKYIKVYIMAQEGMADANFTNKNSAVGGAYAIVVGDANTSASTARTVSNVSLTKGYTAQNLADNGWLNYRWKIYRLVVRPNNLPTAPSRTN